MLNNLQTLFLLWELLLRIFVLKQLRNRPFNSLGEGKQGELNSEMVYKYFLKNFCCSHPYQRQSLASLTC